MADKPTLRREMREKRLLLDEASRIAAAEDFTNLFLEKFGQYSPAVIGGYWPIKGEMNVLPLLKILYQRGWQCALPTMPKDNSKILQFRLWQPEMLLVKNKYGIEEPPASSPAVQPEIILVPLLAVDHAGNRIGYGGGYYDATLAAYPQAISIGCAYAWQQVEALPVEPQDIRLKKVIAV